MAEEETRTIAADNEFRSTLTEYVRSGYQSLFIPTVEEARLEGELQNISKGLDRAFVTWDAANGFSAPEAARSQQKYRLPQEALRAIADPEGPFNGNVVFMFRDLPDYFNDPLTRRLVRGMCEGNKLVNQTWKRPLIISHPQDKIHDALKSCLTLVDFNLPTEDMLKRILDFVKASIERPNSDRNTSFSDELGQDIVGVLRGLTSNEAENVLARCLVRHKGFTPDMLQTIKDEKAMIVKKSEILTYIPEGEMAGRDEIGGFDLLLNWLDRRRLAYGREARKENLDYPKGITLLGVPGTGKSYVAQAMGKLLGLPVYIMDVGAVFGHLVGESESRMRSALKLIQAQQGCVLLLDEADKAFGGAADSSQDSGVTRRVFGQFLTWLAAKKDRTFVVMTMNRTRGIPPEFLRAGRFDAVFYTTLPHPYEIEEIAKIHFTKRGVDPNALDVDKADWATLVGNMKGFVGSEVEEVVKESRYIAFERRQTGIPNFDEIDEAIKGIRPISVLDKENVDAIAKFVKDRAKPVSSPPAKKRTQSRTRAVDIGSN